MKSLFTTALPYRFRNSLVNFYESSGDPGDTGGATGTGAGSHDSGNGNGGDNGNERDTMPGMTVTGTDLSNRGGVSSDGGKEGTDSNYMDMTTTEIADQFALDSDDNRTVAQKMQDFVTKMLVHGLTQNAIAKSLQKMADAFGWGVDIEGTVAKALTSIKRDNPDISDEAAKTKALTDGLAGAVSDITDQGGEHQISDWLSAGADASFDEAKIDPETGESTAAAPGSWEHFTQQFFGTEEGQKSAKEMIQGQADFMKGQFENLSWRKADALNKYTAATEKETGLLDDLIDQSKQGTGLFSPTKFKLAGEDIEFVPRAQRERANQLADFGAGRTDLAKSLLGEETTYADTTLEQSKFGSPEAGGLAYLDALRDQAKIGTGLSLAEGALDVSREGNKITKEGNEPGVLDFIQAVGSIL